MLKIIVDKLVFLFNSMIWLLVCCRIGRNLLIFSIVIVKGIELLSFFGDFLFFINMINWYEWLVVWFCVFRFRFLVVWMIFWLDLMLKRFCLLLFVMEYMSFLLDLKLGFVVFIVIILLLMVMFLFIS